MKIIQLISINLEMKNIGIIVYGRFPTEKAYGSHIIDTANGFIDNNCNVSVFFSKTSNSKTISTSPEEYYGSTKIKFIEIGNYDFTKLFFYDFLPSFVQKVFWTLGAYFWSNNLKSYLSKLDTLWSTNPNLLINHVSSDKNIIYEKHGAGKYVQKYTIKKLSKHKNVYFVGTSKTSYTELANLSPNNTIYLTNGVDLNSYTNNEPRINNQKINIGYIGMLETYGEDKGVKNAFLELKNIAKDYEFKLTLIGGPQEKIDEIVKEFEDTNIEFFYKYKIPKNKVPEYMNTLDIGIVPYPNEFHMANYASPLKIFEYAAGNAAILSSDIKSNLELSETQLGIMYFKADDFDDFREKMINLISDINLRNSLIESSKNSISKYSLSKRIKNLIDFCVRSSTG
tara:strand:- start:4337 stop:5527 length:1191 start_codon:yes stop_codon:yes gene_type:complete